MKVKPDIKQGVTAQGKYVFGADGSAYGFNNNRSVERLNQMLDSSMIKFGEEPPIKVELQPIAKPPSGRQWPEGVAVVRSFTRVRPIPEGCDPMNENVARDHLWILPDEAASLALHKFPESLATRMCRFSLVDNVRGEPDHWKPQEIEMSEFWPSGEGEFTGIFSMQTKNGARGLQGTVSIEVGHNEGRLSKFVAYANAAAWGRSTYTPGEPPGRFPLAIGFILVDDEMSRIVPPQAVVHGREYVGS